MAKSILFKQQPPHGFKKDLTYLLSFDKDKLKVLGEWLNTIGASKDVNKKKIALLGEKLGIGFEETKDVIRAILFVIRSVVDNEDDIANIIADINCEVRDITSIQEILSAFFLSLSGLTEFMKASDLEKAALAKGAPILKAFEIAPILKFKHLKKIDYDDIEPDTYKPEGEIFPTLSCEILVNTGG